MSDQNSMPVNPQLLRLEQKKRPKKKVKEKNEITPKLEDPTETDKEKEPKSIIRPSQALIEEDIKERRIFSNLSKEVTEDELSDEKLTSARDLQFKTIQRYDPMQYRIEKMDVISFQLKELSKGFLERRGEITEWIKKYTERIIHMKRDVKEYEKKMKKRLNQEYDRMAALLLLAERNKQKRILIRDSITKAILEYPKHQLLITTIIELGFNFVQNILWALAVVRDFFRNQR